MSANCFICGRSLTNPSSISRGVGPVCGGRDYRGRLSKRHGGAAGWTSWEAWEVATYPCYTCKNFVIPGSSGEEPLAKGYLVTVYGQTGEFPENSIGGFCLNLSKLVDGACIRAESACRGLGFSRREDKKHGILQGELFTPEGSITVPFN